MSQFISYAQNYEDVMLWRALKHVQDGFYVDVGANDPKVDSVTQAFYERGWRGINIEPMQAYYEALCKERSEDINLPVAAAAVRGEIKFYEVPETGLSTVVPEAARSARKTGRDVVERNIKALPLNQILADHAREPIHFLKIDVEGFEAEVIQGLDLSRWRPWIILIEATVPNSSLVSYEAWEPALLSAAYTFIYFDGLNRFYIAKEHVELGKSFAAPPNSLDNFVSYEQSKLIPHIAWQESVIRDLEFHKRELDALRPELEWERGELHYLRGEIARMREEGKELQAQVKEGETARIEAAELRGGLEVLQGQNDNLRAEVEHLRSQINNLHAETEKLRRNSEEGLRPQINYLQSELKASQAEAENLRNQYVNILYSQSYRITAPLRSLYGLISKLRRGGHNPVASQTDAVRSVLVSETGLPQITREQQEDEQYFLNILQREIDTRKRIG